MSVEVKIEQIRKHYDKLSPLYARYWGPHIHHGYWKGKESTEQAQIQLMEELAATTGIKAGSQVLDIGCGLGGSSLWLAEQLNCQVTGITLSPVQATKASKEAVRRELSDRVRFEVVDANHLPFGPESFDAIWIIECSEHLYDKQLFFKRCADILKPGGVLGVCAWLKGAKAETEEGQLLINGVLKAMLCPSFGTFEEYKSWLSQNKLQLQEARDLTAEVLPTWTNCLKILKRPEVRAFLFMSDQATKEFAASFQLMNDAFETGAMTYGLFSAKKIS